MESNLHPWLPLSLETYDQHHDLTADEERALHIYTQISPRLTQTADARWARTVMMPLETPLNDVIQLGPNAPVRLILVRRVMGLEMLRRHTTYWAWDAREWQETIGPNHHEFTSRFGRYGDSRSAIIAIAYIVADVLEQNCFGRFAYEPSMAEWVFGRDRVTLEYQRVNAILTGSGGLDTVLNVKGLVGQRFCREGRGSFHENSPSLPCRHRTSVPRDSRITRD